MTYFVIVKYLIFSITNNLLILLMQDSPKGTYLLQGGVSLSVLKDSLLEILCCSYGILSFCFSWNFTSLSSAPILFLACGELIFDCTFGLRNEKNQLLLGIRRATRPQTVMPSSVLSSDSMHIGLLAAAAHAANTNSCFTVFFNPRSVSYKLCFLTLVFFLVLVCLNIFYLFCTSSFLFPFILIICINVFRASPSEFVIPLSKYVKAVYHTRVSVGMRFRMLFETEESSVRR